MLMFGQKLGHIALRIIEIAEDEGAGDARVDAGGCRLRIDAGRETLLDARVDAIDWTQAVSDLDAQGCAVLKGLLSPAECRALAALYPDDARFRSRVIMGRHGFGRGEYKYFSYPLPGVIAELRPALYARLRDLAVERRGVREDAG